MSGTQGIGTSTVSFLSARLQYTDSTQSLSDADEAQAASSGQEAACTSSGDGSASSNNISSFGQLLSSLQQLQSQDPEKFQQVVSQIASQLKDASQQQGQSPQGNALSHLADKFQQVADTGDLSKLEAPHHHHHHSGGATYDSAGKPADPPAGPGDGKTALQQLFATIASEVNDALGNQSAQPAALPGE